MLFDAPVGGGMRDRRAPGAGHARGDDAPRGRAAVRRPDPVRPHPPAPVAGRARTTRGDRRRRDLRAVRRATDGSHSRRGRRGSPGGMGSRRLGRPGRPARGDRDGQLHEEPDHRTRRRADHQPQSFPRRGLRHGDDHGPRPQPGARRRRRRVRPVSGRPRSRAVDADRDGGHTGGSRAAWALRRTRRHGRLRRRRLRRGGRALGALQHQRGRRTVRSSGVLAQPGRADDDVGGEQGGVSHADGDRRRRRARRARSRRLPLRGGPDDRFAHPPPRLPRHSRYARRSPGRSRARRQPRCRGAPDPRQQRGPLPHRLLHRPGDRRPHPRRGRRRRLRVALLARGARSSRRRRAPRRPDHDSIATACRSPTSPTPPSASGPRPHDSPRRSQEPSTIMSAAEIGSSRST